NRSIFLIDPVDSRTELVKEPRHHRNGPDEGRRDQRNTEVALRFRGILPLGFVAGRAEQIEYERCVVHCTRDAGGLSQGAYEQSARRREISVCRSRKESREN